MISTTDSVESIVCHISLNASTGLFPEIRSAIDEMMIAAAVAAKGASEARQIRSNISRMPFITRSPFAPRSCTTRDRPA